MWRNFLSKFKPLPYDILNSIFVAFLLGLSAVFRHRLPNVGHLVCVYLGLLLMITLCSVLPADFDKRISLIHFFYPLILVPIVFESLGNLIIYINLHFWDPTLARLDTLICGVAPCVYLQRFIRPWLTEILQLAYISYYFMPAILGIAFWCRKDKRLPSAIFTTLLGFYISYIGYLLFPALGPRFYLADPHCVYEHTFLAKQIAHCLNVLEHNKTDAFPSGHTQISLMCTYFAGYLGKKWAAIYAILTTLLIISTIYCRYHYLVDVIAGILLAGICLKIAPKLEACLKRFGN